MLPSDEHYPPDEPADTVEHDTTRVRSRSTETPSSWWSILNSLGIKPSKALGQNFLHDVGIVRRIADTAELSPSDLVVEVGPGLGVLTRELAERSGSVIAIELDHRLAEYVGNLNLPHTHVIEGDILKVDLTSLTERRPYVVVANLPYSIASAAIAHMLENDSRPDRVVVMVQREVAERIAARPPNMSILSVAVQFFGSPRIMFRIGPGAFVPPPKIESAVLRIEVHKHPPLEPVDWPAFFGLVRAGFSQRRKQLLNAVTSALKVDKSLVAQTLTAAAIDPRRRAETLDVSDWVRFFRAFQQVQTDV